MSFAPTIPDKLFFRIGEVCDLVGIKPHVLRYWETEFPQLRPSKTSGGSRLYRRKDIERISTIKYLLYEKRYTIAGARKALSELQALEKSEDSAEAIRQALDRLKQIRETLE